MIVSNTGSMNIPDKKNRVTGNESLCTYKDTPACSKKMPLWLTCIKDGIQKVMQQPLLQNTQRTELKGKTAHHERCDGISTHCHEDLLPSTPGMEVAD